MATLEALMQYYSLPEFMSINISYDENKWLAWICAVLGAFLVGLSGVVPLLIMPDTTPTRSCTHKDVNYTTTKEDSVTETKVAKVSRTISSEQISTKLLQKEAMKKERTLNRYLSFAVGGLLGDICLHLLPEIYSPKTTDSIVIYDEDQQLRLGLSILAGILSFLAIEKLFDFTQVCLFMYILRVLTQAFVLTNYC